MKRIDGPSTRKIIAHGIAAGLAVLAFSAGTATSANAGVTAVYGPYQDSTQCWIDVEAAHENGQTVTQGCQWRSYNGRWGYYFTAY
ncbi:hypothetical protein [Microlunatus parietis]|uniref:Secreted protein n=1 Tax=Microlunatus parietis TaxID=682979 RepID=A0A7Y9IB49_9ACTN|nr:hypothetical protein [Microlunatus parietis]NYE73447.1 hypothetical protein [Microlunatus parietis]